MKIFMIGEAANHKVALAASLPKPHDIIGLPREAAYSSEFDSGIGRDDVIISLRYSRKGSAVPPFRLLHVPGAGLDGIDFDSLPSACWVCNVFEHEIPIAEFVLLAMLRWEIRLEDMRRSFSPQTWSSVYRNRVPHGELFGQTLGLIGFGRIGRAVAQRARAFGMRIMAIDVSVGDAGELADELLQPRDLSRLLEESDFLIVACPLTESTRGMIGARELRVMKRTAVVINISRAEILKEEDLYEALRDTTISGAYLDVWYQYPVGVDDVVEPARFPFHELPNAVCTPHSSAWTSNLPGRRYAFIAKNLVRLQAGEPLLNVVRPPREEETAKNENRQGGQV